MSSTGSSDSPGGLLSQGNNGSISDDTGPDTRDSAQVLDSRRQTPIHDDAAIHLAADPGRRIAVDGLAKSSRKESFSPSTLPTIHAGELGLLRSNNTPAQISTENRVQQLSRNAEEDNTKNNDTNGTATQLHHLRQNNINELQESEPTQATSASPSRESNPSANPHNERLTTPPADENSQQNDLENETPDSDDSDAEDPFADLHGIQVEEEEDGEKNVAENLEGASGDDSDGDLEDPSVDASIMITNPDDDNYVNLLRQKDKKIRDLREIIRQRDRHYHDQTQARRSRWNDKKAALEYKIQKLRAKLKKSCLPKTPWITLMHHHLRDIPIKDKGVPAWDEVFEASCRQENMSQNSATVHPDLDWNGRRFKDRRFTRPHRDILRDAAIGRDTIPTLNHGINVPFADEKAFQFTKLPGDIQQRIFEHLLVKPGLVHCISRLNKLNKPVEVKDFPFPSSGESKLPHRFVYGNQEHKDILTREPGYVLKLLLVCKRWLFIGIHVFYGMNTFAFSSLGEFGRFFNGIGQARAERVAHVELLWHGSIMPRHESRINQRTLPLLWLTRMKRLETLTVFIDESNPKRIRRKYEFPKLPEEDKPEEEWRKIDLSDRDRNFTKANIANLTVCQSLLKRTAIQPNWRGNRSMRTCHGMDYVYQLRGMKWVRFYEFNQSRDRIRDWSFTDDISSVVTMPKDRRYDTECDLRNLTVPAGLNDFIPEDQDRAMVVGFYEPKTSQSVCGGSETSVSYGNSSQSSAPGSEPPHVGGDDGSDGDVIPILRFPDESDFGGNSDIEMRESDEDAANIMARSKFPDEVDSNGDIDVDGDGFIGSKATCGLDNTVFSAFPRQTANSYNDIDSGVEDMEGDNEPFSDSEDEEIGGTDLFDGSEHPHKTQLTIQDDQEDDSLFVEPDQHPSPGHLTVQASHQISNDTAMRSTFGTPAAPTVSVGMPSLVTNFNGDISENQRPHIIDLTGDSEDEGQDDSNTPGDMNDSNSSSDGERLNDISSLFIRGSTIRMKSDTCSEEKTPTRSLTVDLSTADDNDVDVKPTLHNGIAVDVKVSGAHSDRRASYNPSLQSDEDVKPPKHILDDDDKMEGPSAKRARTDSIKREMSDERKSHEDKNCHDLIKREMSESGEVTAGATS